LPSNSTRHQPVTRRNPRWWYTIGRASSSVSPIGFAGSPGIGGSGSVLAHDVRITPLKTICDTWSRRRSVV
jgi:hypothetical protein